MNIVFPQKKVTDFRQKVWDFYRKNGRNSLSFRGTINPYHIHVSEVMLSQTQVNRVESYFIAWIKQFPTITSVVEASQAELLQAWQGLGYNSRVLNFQKSCWQLLDEFEGRYPQCDKKLQTLRGVGPYVASAICAFAFNKNTGVVDTNIRRILLYYGFITVEHKPGEVQNIAKILTPKDKARDWNNALMDYGALYLTAKRTGIASVGKQDKFIGSTRYVRSFIIKTCLQNGSCAVIEVEKLCEKYQHNSKDIVDKLTKKKVIYQKIDRLYIVLNALN